MMMIMIKVIACLSFCFLLIIAVSATASVAMNADDMLFCCTIISNVRNPYQSFQSILSPCFASANERT